MDVSLVVQQRNPTGAGANSWRRRRSVGDGGAYPTTGRLREELGSTTGSVVYYTGANDAPLEICLQSLSAHPDSPNRVALNITQRPADEEDEEESEESGGDKQSETEHQLLAKRSISRMSADVTSLDRKLRSILSSADYAKEQEVEFHEQSIAMNRASQYWPIIHLVVLLVTGFTQANHIVRFFKSRRIF